MAITSTITLEMLLNEAIRIGEVMKRHYPQQVKDKKITPYTRDHRYRCNEKLISLLQQAMKNKETNGPKLLEILKQQP